jgi:hypothetical protein
MAIFAGLESGTPGLARPMPVLMAIGTGGKGGLLLVLSMALGTADLAMATFQRVPCAGMVETLAGNVLPAFGAVALDTIGPQASGVGIPMAIGARLVGDLGEADGADGRVLLMALDAISLKVAAGQGKT